MWITLKLARCIELNNKEDKVLTAIATTNVNKKTGDVKQR